MRDELKGSPGDPTKGAQVFKDFCAKCHRLFGEGAAIGPELTQANRMDREYLLTNIVDPNQAIHTRYTQYVIRATSGEEFNGLIAQRTANAITLINATGATTEIAVEDVDEIREAGTSLMPEGLITNLAGDDVRNLFAYLQSEGPKPAAGQRSKSVAQTMVWFENDGQCRFAKHDITTSPTHLLVLAASDMDNDGWCDFVTGGMNAFPPFDSDISRVLLWHNDWPNRRVSK